ncbi:MAG: glucose-6-phosphate dehydrogenase, partial [Bacteroidia bacterium]|nr:glucose-6-phosphate dehydrogenase [Bacteroidia bacterium]
MEKPNNLILVIFGASGDLTSRKLIPALYSLSNQNLMPEKFALLGVGRSEISSTEFREKMANAIRTFSDEKDPDFNHIAGFTEYFEYQRIDYISPPDYKELGRVIQNLCQKHGIGGNIIFYLATPPSLYETISTNLAEAGLGIQSDGFKHFIIEKPFGYDLESARRLNKTLHGLVQEDQIFRIDHYLGKETVQNLLVTRFANGIFEPLWNRNYVHRIEITSAESIGVGERGGYYDSSGALRDMVQNHLL